MTPAPAAPVPDDATLDRAVWRRTLIASLFAQTAAIMGFTFVMPFLRLYLRDELGLTDDTDRALWAGYIFSAPGFLMAFVSPLWGILADRFGRKLMVLRAMLGGAIIITLMGFATTPGQLLALRIAQGALTGTITACAALVTSVCPSNRAGFSMGMMQAAIFAGNAVGPVLGGLTADTFGGRRAFFVAGVMLLAGGIVIALFAREGATRGGRDGAPGGQRMQTIGEVIRSPGFIAILVLVFVMNLSRSFPGVIFQEYIEVLAGTRGNVNTLAGSLLALMFATASVTSMIMGRLADRVGHAALIIGGTIAGGVFCIPQTFVQDLWQLFALRVLLGISAGTIGPAMGKFVHASFPRSSHGRAFGIVQSANSFANALGPLAGGLVNAAFIPLYGVEQALRLPFAVAGVFQLIVGLFAWVVFAHVRPGRPPRETPPAGLDAVCDAREHAPSPQP